VTADIIEHHGDFPLGKLLDQTEQFVPLHAHHLIVRSKVHSPRSERKQSYRRG
jgi:hypothetical protein